MGTEVGRVKQSIRKIPTTTIKTLLAWERLSLRQTFRQETRLSRLKHEIGEKMEKKIGKENKGKKIENNNRRKNKTFKRKIKRKTKK